MEGSRSEMFRRLLARDPENPMVLYSLGSELYKEERYSEAREYLSRAVENKQDYSVAYRALGRALYELGEDAAARRVFGQGRRGGGAAVCSGGVVGVRRATEICRPSRR